LQHVRVALRQAARDHQRLAAAGLFELGVLEDGVDRFLLGLADEGAGIDEDDLRLARLLDERVPLVEQAAEHDLAVHPVLGAAEREEVEGLRHSAGIRSSKRVKSTMLRPSGRSMSM